MEDDSERTEEEAGLTEVGQVLKVLSRAIARETAAFNYYYKGSEDKTLPAGVRGLLERLAEEERRHRYLLLNEYMTVQKSWSNDGAEDKEHSLSYHVPDEFELTSLSGTTDIEITSISLPGRLLGGDNIISEVIRGRDKREKGTFLMLYDVMGHSIKTTEINALAARLLGEYIEASSSGKMEMELLSPKNIVCHLNERFGEKFEGQGVFLTLLCLLIDFEDKMMTFTIAGHEPPFLVHDRGKVGSLLNTQLILGVDTNFTYRESKVPFESGNVFCIFSDGLVEAKGPGDEIFGRDRIAACLEKTWEGTPEEIIKNIMAELREFSSGIPLEDEISIVVIRSKGE
ncbi:MAG: SpoIIE family protein phosphatase [Candidatus Krumholzibacteriota bacterium]|nr:SpoIIE family protein phosphatase [Candidatus Krumholzibacteriota bacterium]